MAIDGISSINSYSLNGAQNDGNQRRNDFKALATALKSGDLAGAQKAFASLQQDMSGVSQSQSGQQTGQQGSSQRDSDIQTLSQALKSGDLTGAQKAFASLQQDLHVAHGHHHHGPSGATQGTPAGVTGANVSNSDSDKDGDNDTSSLIGGVNVTV